MKKLYNKGFTMVELVIVLVIAGILAAIGIPAATHFIHLAEFRKNEENARTAYLAAESVVTWYRSSGQWDEFCEKVTAQGGGTANNTFPEPDEKNGRIYAVMLDKGEAPGSGSDGALAAELLEGVTYGGDFFDAAIAIEIDIKTGHIYSAFYGTRCERLSYDGDDGNGVLNISAAPGNRSYESRKKRLLGYYSAQDVTNVAELKPVRLKVTTINLVNSETLSLNWTSNSRHDNLDVKYAVKFYDKESDKELFHTEIDRDMIQDAKDGRFVLLNLKRPDPAGGADIDMGNWAFPLSYQSSGGAGGRFSLVLDGMMSADVMEAITSSPVDKRLDAMKSYSTSITRFGYAAAGSDLEKLKDPLDLYATINVQPVYGAVKGEFTEYKPSGEVKSNVENTLYDESEIKGGNVLDARISRFRHLSNIRYFDRNKEAAFTLTAGKLDWTLAGVGMYEGVSDETGLISLKWSGSVQGDTVLDFPSVRMLYQKHTLQGGYKTTAIANLKLGADSMPDDSLISNLYPPEDKEKHVTRYLGLFGETEGTVRNLTLSDPVLFLAKEENKEAEAEMAPPEDFQYLQGVGILSGRSQGTLKDITIDTSSKERRILTVCIGAAADGALSEADNKPVRPAGIGGLVGVLAGREDSGELISLNKARENSGAASPANGFTIKNLTVNGSVTGILPAPEADIRQMAEGEQEEAKLPEQRAADYPYGVGGIFGYAMLRGDSDPYDAAADNYVCIESCKNHADVTGNLFTGGIVGNIRDNAGPGGMGINTDEDTGAGSGGNAGADTEASGKGSIEQCENDGLILCAVKYHHDETEEVLEGRYFGGIAGFGHKVWINNSSCASGRAKNYVYTFAQKENVLLGQYVGGIIGYGSSSRLAGCRSQKGGYVLGSDYVGGIAGGLSNDAREAITGSAGIEVTINAGYVIGNSYVGGIVGKNDGDEYTTLTNCINNGVAAGYESYIGGIVGYNGSKGRLLDCASYLSDYNGSLLRTIVEDWQAVGDFAGGLAGYNDGTIRFTEESQKITVKSVSGIVVGRDYVGGVIGFNDVQGTVDVSYKLLGGQIHASGNAVGGCIGLNASTAVLAQSLTIQPVSVTGKYYVGGVIGANVIDMITRTKEDADARGVQKAQDVAMTGIKTDNTLGSITGEAFTGGVIGYQRTYTKAQLATASKQADITLLDYLQAKKNGFFGSKEDGGAIPDSMLPLLPELMEDADHKNVPTKVLASGNPYTLTIGDKSYNKEQLIAYNNMPVYCDMYTGGIVGYCERSSRLVIVNCMNAGRLSKNEEKEGAKEGMAVSLRAYLESQEVNADASELGEVQESEDKEIEVSIGGGIIGANLDHQVIDHCVNTGTMNGFIGLGGIVGFNAGGVFNCELSDNFGNAGLSFIGGIAGLNVKSDTRDASGVSSGEQPNETVKNTYKDIKGNQWEYDSGMIAGCGTKEKISLSGFHCVGGIAGYNFSGAVLSQNRNRASITAAGDYAGGIAGVNCGEIRIMQPDTEEGNYEITIAGNNGTGIGGIVGWNRRDGKVLAVGNDGMKETDVIAIDEKVSVTGMEKVGGIIGINAGVLDTAVSGAGTALPGYLVCEAKLVRAAKDCAGGVIGEAQAPEKEGSVIWAPSITRAINASRQVTADNGRAGGIVAVNAGGFALSKCINMGNVKADNGYAGGITAENYGQIVNCKVGDEGVYAPKNRDKDSGDILIVSRGADAIGAVCAVNYGEIRNSMPVFHESIKNDVILSGSARMVGGVAGKNTAGAEAKEADPAKISGGIIGSAYNPDKESAADYAVTYMPKVDISASGLTVGGIVGLNEKKDGAAAQAQVTDIEIRGFRFEGFENYKYLGGIAGENQAEVAKCTAGQERIIQNRANDAAGNCYGGIAGKNGGTLDECRVSGIVMQVEGVYTATVTSTAREKEALATQVGGIAGKNEESGSITGCLLEEGKGNGTDAIRQNSIALSSGMAGGVAGYNKGSITLSGDVQTGSLMKSGNTEIQDVQSLIVKAQETEAREANANRVYVQWGGAGLDNKKYNNGAGVTADRDFLLTVSGNGNLGGITAYNSPTGMVSHCATGDWYLNNKSQAIGVGTGGIIGMNESEKNLSFLYNQAFVGRELDKGATNRFAGGIIGNQNNTTTSGWAIQDSVNCGMIHCMNTHYAGGIMGQWTGRGGNIERCYNYGNLQTTYVEGWLGAAAGIVAQLYHAYENNEYNIISCGNFGSIYGKDGAKADSCANDSAGILGNITAYNVGAGSGQKFTINVTDCVNGAGVEIYSTSMASGIVGFFSCDNPGNGAPISNATSGIILNIERCRNYADRLQGNNFVAGILGDRYGEDGARNTTIKYCFSVNRSGGNYNKVNYPVISYLNDSFSKDHAKLINGADKSSIYNYFLDQNYAQSFRSNDFTPSAYESNIQRANSVWIYSVPNPDDSATRCFIYLKPGTSNVIFEGRQKNIEFSSNANEKKYGDVIYRISGNQRPEVGKVLFTADAKYDSMNSIVNGSDIKVSRDFDKDYVRKLCLQMANMLIAPQKVELSKTEDNRLTISVTPGDNAEGVSYEAVLYRKGVSGAPDEEIEAKMLTLDPGGTKTGDGNSFRFPSNSLSLELDQEEINKGGRVYVLVKAVRNDGGSEPSAQVKSNLVEIGNTLPEPAIRIELTKTGTNGSQYRFRLENQADYQDYANLPDNEKLMVFVELMDKSQLSFDVFDQNTSAGNRTDRAFATITGDSLQQLKVQVKGQITENGAVRDGKYASEEISVPVYLPKDVPEIKIKSTGIPPTEPACTVSGTSLQDLRINVTLNLPEGTGTVTTPPVYRAELIGTWVDESGKEYKETVFQSEDILTSTSGAATAVFANIPEYIADAANQGKETNFRMRVWYAESGLGPVYTWSGDLADDTQITDANAGRASAKYLIGTPAAGGAGDYEFTWEYVYTPVLEGKNGVFQDYVWTSGEKTGKALFTLLKAPVLMELPAGQTSLSPETDGDTGHLQYTFKWDETEYKPGYRYKVSLAGLVKDEAGNTTGKVSILTDQEVPSAPGYPAGNSITVDAENWSYGEVELTVTRLGGMNGGMMEIGQTSVGTYRVKQRLPQPAQPRVTNPDINELNYEIEWDPVSPEKGCERYEIYVKPYEKNPDDPDGEEIPGAGVKLDEIYVTDTATGDSNKTDGVYRTKTPVSLEAYVGKNILIYIKAQPEPDDPDFVHSVDGVTYSLAVPKRIGKPDITWNKNWEHKINDSGDKETVRTVEEFEGGGLSVDVTAKDDKSVPPGGSSYLLKAYIFDSEENAKKALAAEGTAGAGTIEELENLTGLLATYPAFYEADSKDTGEGAKEKKWTLAQMDASNSAGTQYGHELSGLAAKYAGKYIVFYARISSGAGNVSSPWVSNVNASDASPQVWRLPYVKLATPQVTVDYKDYDIDVTLITNPDLGGKGSGTSKADEKEADSLKNEDLSDKESGVADGDGTTDATESGTADGDGTTDAAENGNTDSAEGGAGSGDEDDAEKKDDPSKDGNTDENTVENSGNSSGGNTGSNDSSHQDNSADSNMEGGDGSSDSREDGGESSCKDGGNDTGGTVAQDKADSDKKDKQTASVKNVIPAAVKKVLAENCLVQVKETRVYAQYLLAKPVVQKAAEGRLEQEETFDIQSQADAPVETKEDWTARHIVLKWNSVEYADTYHITLTEKAGEADASERITGFMIVENKTDNGNNGFILYREKPDGTFEEIIKVEGKIPEAGEEYSLSQYYSRTVEGKYQKETDYEIPYRADLQARLEVAPDGDGGLKYTLVLPDAVSLWPKAGGNSIEDGALRFTNLVEISADVKENTPVGNPPPDGSDAYVRSDPYEREF